MKPIFFVFRACFPISTSLFPLFSHLKKNFLPRVEVEGCRDEQVAAGGERVREANVLRVVGDLVEPAALPVDRLQVEPVVAVVDPAIV